MCPLGFSFWFLIVAAMLATDVIAQANGPMSSGYKPPPAAAEAPTPPAPPIDARDAKGQLDVRRLFAGTCGWCHSNGGRTAGKGPQLMGTTLTDAEIVNRVKRGKPGAMPAFGDAFTDADIQAIIRYIRELKDEGKPN